MHNTKNHPRFKDIRFPMTEFSDWDSYGLQYEAEKRAQQLNDFKKAEQLKVKQEENVYDEEHPAFLSREYWDKERQDAKLYLRRFQAERGLIE